MSGGRPLRFARRVSRDRGGHGRRHPRRVLDRVDVRRLGHVLGRFDFGVPLFFLMSGFLLYRPWAGGVDDATSGRRTSRRYAVRRAARILPLYWVVVVVTLALFPEIQPVPGDQWWVHLLRRCRSTSRGGAIEGLTQTWSLCTEISFYALLPGLGWLATGRAPRAPLSGLAPPVWLLGHAWSGVSLGLARLPGHAGAAGRRGGSRPTSTGSAPGCCSRSSEVRLAPRRPARGSRASRGAGRGPATCLVIARVVFAIPSRRWAVPTPSRPAPVQTILKHWLYPRGGVLPAPRRPRRSRRLDGGGCPQRPAPARPDLLRRLPVAPGPAAPAHARAGHRVLLRACRGPRRAVLVSTMAVATSPTAGGASGAALGAPGLTRAAGPATVADASSAADRDPGCAPWRPGRAGRAASAISRRRTGHPRAHGHGAITATAWRHRPRAATRPGVPHRRTRSRRAGAAAAHDAPRRPRPRSRAARAPAPGAHRSGCGGGRVVEPDRGQHDERSAASGARRAARSGRRRSGAKCSAPSRRPRRHDEGLPPAVDAHAAPGPAVDVGDPAGVGVLGQLESAGGRPRRGTSGARGSPSMQTVALQGRRSGRPHRQVRRTAQNSPDGATTHACRPCGRPRSPAASGRGRRGPSRTAPTVVTSVVGTTCARRRTRDPTRTAGSPAARRHAPPLVLRLAEVELADAQRQHGVLPARCRREHGTTSAR